MKKFYIFISLACFTILLHAQTPILYALTSSGGSNSKGAIIKYDASSNLLTADYHFSGPDGAAPQGSLLQASNGLLYGMARDGGVNNLGVIFSYDPCTNTYSNSTEMWNMDLDEYDLSSYVEVDDTVLDIKVTTAADVVFFNAIVLSVYSVFPDATMSLDSYKNYCHTRRVDVNYTVANHKGNHPLKKDTPIAFYVNNELIGTAKTDSEVAEGSEIKQTMTLDIPKKFGYRFDLVANVDDTGNSKGIVFEIDEENNSSKTHIDLTRDCPIQKGVSANFDGANDGFDLSIYDLNKLRIYNRYGSEVFTYGKGYTNQWVGQNMNNKALPTGTYFYVFTTDYETISGYVYLIKEVR